MSDAANPIPKGRPRLFPPRVTPPCADCGTAGGYVPKRHRRPARLDGARFGVAGTLCAACYNSRNGRLRIGLAQETPAQRARREEAARGQEADRAEIARNTELVRAWKRGEMTLQELDALLPLPGGCRTRGIGRGRGGHHASA